MNALPSHDRRSTHTRTPAILSRQPERDLQMHFRFVIWNPRREFRRPAPGEPEWPRWQLLSDAPEVPPSTDYCEVTTQ